MTTMARQISRLLFPSVVAVGAALLVGGYDGAGDGFSAGLVVSIGAVIQYLFFDTGRAGRAIGAQHALPMMTVGLLVVLGFAFAPLVVGAAPVTHWPSPSAHVSSLGALKAHTALLFDVGVALIVYGGVVSIIDRLLREPKEEGAAR